MSNLPKVVYFGSTVGTITELADYFKVWFANVATLYDPANGESITDDNPQSAWKELLEVKKDQSVMIAFPVNKPQNLKWSEVLKPLSSQGYTRVVYKNKVIRLEDLKPPTSLSNISVIQDRVTIEKSKRSRTLEALQTAFNFGQGRILVYDTDGQLFKEFIQGLQSTETGEIFRPAAPAMFSFNSPIGACEECRGFGRVIEIDYRLVIPDHSKSIDEGAIRAFQGEVYSESLRDLQRAAKKHKISTSIPWSKLSKKALKFVMEGEPSYEPDTSKWYGVHRFFGWLNSNLYKMHVRVFLSKFRSYTECPKCHGARLQLESLYWKWNGHTLPELYQKSAKELLELLTTNATQSKPFGAQSKQDVALSGILSRLQFLDTVGLDYLTLDRSSRTLSGGETMRVSLTACLGSALTDTLFVLDEPSVGLHPRDMDRLISILRRLTELGNTVVVVEHDEAIMRAADSLIEIGPEPGINGGQLVFQGNYQSILKSNTHTGRFLSGREAIQIPQERRLTKSSPPLKRGATKQSPDWGGLLSVYGASKHNLKNIDIHIPQQSFVCLSGVSGSGKSTLLNNVIYQNLLAQKGLTVEEPASIKDIETTLPLSNVVLVDQSPISKTPRATPASFTGA
ncbi:ATP-binding cassette domain-containing protein, partial [Puniceicoccaceae bacterium]|nr:ATP-binding cassette domain-containing protein [Puniceicoccaceae bacterium]